MDSEFQNKANIQQIFEKSDDLYQYFENSSTFKYNSYLFLLFLLGLTMTENVKWLCKYIGVHYSNIFDLEYKQYKAKKEINSIIKSVKRNASSLEAEIEQGIQIDLALNLQNNDECSDIEKIVTKKHRITVLGFSVKINITCNKCTTTVFYKNKTDGIDYSKLVAGAGLVGGVNREEWATILYVCGIIRQKFLKGITQLAPYQSLITKMCTSQNESVNRIKLNYTDKKQDYPKSYKTRHALAVIHNNNGLLELLQILRQAEEILKFSNQDLLNIAMI
ncbi:43579_t:CDS:2 [Gigaspora margarita]|uniref:43579_t:CDS:1 n=1 Tax=Gigaspora margarita TaxID=4874 RepID=A0ABN7V4B0_GIGMA|nr:43579_t:CDS:2 [Gigaspora margarita]